MPLRNRVLPTGDIVADPPYRGAFMGNRGILHGAAGVLGRKRWVHKAWVTCRLSFKGRRRTLMQPGRYTELFFYDEAVAFAAGHRPCGECRRADYTAFRSAACISGPIAAFDKALHAERARPRVFEQRRHVCEISDLPPGSFILSDAGRPMLLLDDTMRPFLAGRYGAAEHRPASGSVTALTPPLLLSVLRAGYVPMLRLPEPTAPRR